VGTLAPWRTQDWIGWANAVATGSSVSVASSWWPRRTFYTNASPVMMTGAVRSVPVDSTVAR
jgi:hypothetical protein